MADRSTAAVGVANEGGATSDGTMTDDQTSTTSAESAAADASRGRQPRASRPAADPERGQDPDATQPLVPDADDTQAMPAEESNGRRPEKAPGKTPEKAPGKTAEKAAETAAETTLEQTAERTVQLNGSRNGAKGARSAAKGSRTAAAEAPAASPDGSSTGAAGAAAGPQKKPGAAAASASSTAGTGASDAGTGSTAAKASATPSSATTSSAAAAPAAGANPADRRAVRGPVTAPELHSGHKLARRYQLEECVTRVDGFSSWRAVDEKLRRAVGIHILPSDHPRGRQVLAAARSAALLGDPRFVQVLDAVEESDLVYVIHEWLPDAASLTDLLAAGPLEPHEAYQMVSQVSQGMAAAHREGLAHLRLDPGDVLRTVSGQYRIRGLAVAAALRGLNSDRPQRKDTESIGALLYAALTQRWPYEEDAHGLTGLPKGVGLVAPDQVRAGVHRGLSEVAMRALVNEGATASREEPPCTTPEELAKVVASVPRIRRPDPKPPVYQPAAYQTSPYQPPAPPAGGPGRPPAGRQPVAAPPPPPPALPGRTGQALKWAVAALVVVAIGLGSWQLADAMKSNENQSTKNPAPTGPKGGQATHRAVTSHPLTITGAKEFTQDGALQDTSDIAATYDGKLSTYWRTKTFNDGPVLAPYKPGVGVIYDLGSPKAVRSATLDLRYAGDHTTVELYGTDSFSDSAPLSGMTKLASTKSSQNKVRIDVRNPHPSRYVVVWFTALPYSSTEDYYRAGYKQALEEISFTG